MEKCGLGEGKGNRQQALGNRKGREFENPTPKALQSTIRNPNSEIERLYSLFKNQCPVPDAWRLTRIALYGERSRTALHIYRARRRFLTQMLPKTGRDEHR